MEDEDDVKALVFKPVSWRIPPPVKKTPIDFT
jgi:hypothetical protein